MTIERRTIIDQIEISRDGHVGVRLAKIIVEGETVLAKQYHRLLLEPGIDLAQAFAAVGDHLESMGEQRPTEDEWKRVREVVKQQHTKERIAEHRRRVRERVEAEAAAAAAAERKPG